MPTDEANTISVQPDAAYLNRHYYLPVDEQLRAYEVYVTSLGNHAHPPGTDYPAPGHPSVYDFDWSRGRVLPEFAVVLISRGRGVFEGRSSGSVDVAAGQILLIPPGAWHRYRPDREVGWEEWWLCMNGEYLHRLVRKKLLPSQATTFAAEDLNRLIGQFKHAFALMDANNTANSTSMTLAALQVLFEVIKDRQTEVPITGPSAEDTRDDPLVSRALLFIWNHSHRPITVPQVAKAVSVHVRTLERRFADCGYHTVQQAILDCRLRRACELLRTTNMSVKEIAFTVGFSQPKRLNESFQRHFNTTPLAYRRDCK